MCDRNAQSKGLSCYITTFKYINQDLCESGLGIWDGLDGVVAYIVPLSKVKLLGFIPGEGLKLSN